MAVRIDWQPGEVFLDHFRVERLLGSGGMGRVYRVEHRAWGMQLVVKIPRAELVDDVTHMLSFERECETWINLGSHPNIVSCYFLRRYEEIPLVFAEYVSHGSLHDWIRRGRLYQGDAKAVNGRIMDIAIQSAQGLAFAHERGLVHQDVKPANIMIGAKGLAKVTDFGLARAHAAIGGRVAPGSPTVTAAGMTPAYCSPEQAGRERLSPQSDLWSWAVSVLEMYTGGCHWMSGVAAREVLREHIHQQNSPERVGYKVPKELALYLDTCFRTEPARRPAGMAAVISDLQEIYLNVTQEYYPRVGGVESGGGSDPAAVANANNRAISMIELGHHEAALDVLKEAEQTARGFGELAPTIELQDLAYNNALLQIRSNPVYNPAYVPSLIPKRPNELRHELLVGQLFLEAGRISEAIDQLTRPAQRVSDFQGQALNVRGIALLLAGETAPAILSFETALELKPDRLEYLRNLAIARYYHGDTYGALSLFERLSREQRLDAADTVRFAAILSSAGQVQPAAALLESAGDATASPALLSTAAEVGLGVQTFLPDLVPVGSDPAQCRRWLLQALSLDPDHLRAEIVRRRQPGRVVLAPESPLRRGRRLPADQNDPEELADRLAASYEGLQLKNRWGVFPTGQGAPAWVLATILPIIGGLLAGAWLFDTERLLENFGSDSLWVRATCWLALVLVTALVVLRRTPAPSALKATFTYGFFVPSGVFLPTLIHESYVMPSEANNSSGTTLDFFGLCVFTLVALFFLRDVPLRMLSRRVRAWGSYRRPAAAIVSPRGETTTMATNISRALTLVTGIEGSSTSRLAYWMDRLSTSFWRIPPKVYAAALRYRCDARGWHILLLPQCFILAVADSAWIAWTPEASMAAYGVLMIFAEVIFWLLIPLFPRVFIILNFIVAPVVAYQFVNSMMPDYAFWRFPLAAALLALNLRALRLCPAFAPLWNSVPPGRWKVDSFVDPLDLRRYAAPWHLIRVTEPAEKM